MAQSKKKEEVKGVEGKLSVTRSMYSNEESEDQIISITPFKSEPAYVSVKAGFTLNLGNYESGRVDVMVSMPCYPEEIDSVYPTIKEWVDTRLADEYKEMKSSVRGK